MGARGGQPLVRSPVDRLECRHDGAHAMVRRAPVCWRRFKISARAASEPKKAIKIADRLGSSKLVRAKGIRSDNVGQNWPVFRVAYALGHGDRRIVPPPIRERGGANLRADCCRISYVNVPVTSSVGNIDGAGNYVAASW